MSSQGVGNSGSMYVIKNIGRDNRSIIISVLFSC